jgi:hypothetical protein
MKIYGKSLTEIFSMLPWAYKAVVVMGTAFFLFAVPYSLHFFLTLGMVSDKVEPIAFPGLAQNTRGMLDPSVASDGKVAVMAHTTTSLININGAPQLSAEINLERATAPCRSWMTISGAGFAAKEDADVPGMFKGDPPLNRGVWRYETPAIVYDPDDPGREWKLFAYRYFWNGDEKTARYYSMIVSRTASRPDSNWSEEKWVFAPNTQWPPEPFASLAEHRLSEISPELADVVFYARPSVVYVAKQKTLFMTLSAFTTASSLPDRIIMLASIDHGANWSYRGVVMRASDVPKMGNYTNSTGGNLLMFNDQMYLALVLGNTVADGLGTTIIPFEDVLNAKLKRDEKTGAPVIVNHLPRNSMQPSKIGGGFAAYTDMCRTGMMISEYSDIRSSFQIFKTYKKPLDK